MEFNITSHKCWYENISSQFNFHITGLKVKVTAAFLAKNFVIVLAPVFINGFQYIFQQLLGIKISRASLTFRLLGSRSR